MTERKIRMWTSGEDKDGKIELRPYGENSVLLGHILPMLASDGKSSLWGFEGACKLGDRLKSEVWSHAEKGLNEYYIQIELAWNRVVGDPSPDERVMTVTVGNLIHDKLNGQAVQYRDFFCYDINLGAIMSKYENAGWGEWFLWNPGTALVGDLAARAGRSRIWSVVQTRATSAWQDETRSYNR